mgnify:FL=1
MSSSPCPPTPDSDFDLSDELLDLDFILSNSMYDDVKKAPLQQVKREPVAPHEPCHGDPLSLEYESTLTNIPQYVQDFNRLQQHRPMVNTQLAQSAAMQHTSCIATASPVSPPDFKPFGNHHAAYPNAAPFNMVAMPQQFGICTPPESPSGYFCLPQSTNSLPPQQPTVPAMYQPILPSPPNTPVEDNSKQEPAKKRRGRRTTYPKKVTIQIGRAHV